MLSIDWKAFRLDSATILFCNKATMLLLKSTVSSPEDGAEEDEGTVACAIFDAVRLICDTARWNPANGMDRSLMTLSSAAGPGS
jgi:hypothetical protein